MSEEIARDIVLPDRNLRFAPVPERISQHQPQTGFYLWLVSEPPVHEWESGLKGLAEHNIPAKIPLLPVRTRGGQHFGLHELQHRLGLGFAGPNRLLSPVLGLGGNYGPLFACCSNPPLPFGPDEPPCHYNYAGEKSE